MICFINLPTWNPPLYPLVKEKQTRLLIAWPQIKIADFKQSRKSSHFVIYRSVKIQDALGDITRKAYRLTSVEILLGKDCNKMIFTYVENNSGVHNRYLTWFDTLTTLTNSHN